MRPARVGDFVILAYGWANALGVPRGSQLGWVFHISRGGRIYVMVYARDSRRWMRGRPRKQSDVLCYIPDPTRFGWIRNAVARLPLASASSTGGNRDEAPPV